MLACVGAGAWGIVAYATPKVEILLDDVAAMYDEYLPEITIRDGKASIREEQPYFVPVEEQDDLVLVIDTRPGKSKEALQHLKDAPNGAVLTQESLLVKQPQQIRIIPLKDMPDMVLSSGTLQDMIRDYFPLVVRVAVVLAVLYLLVAKPFQVLILALIPYFAAQSYSVRLTYGEACKLATFAMIPPVILDLILSFTRMSYGALLGLYLGLYLLVLVVMIKDLIKTAPGVVDAGSAITPD